MCEVLLKTRKDADDGIPRPELIAKSGSCENTNQRAKGDCKKPRLTRSRSLVEIAKPSVPGPSSILELGKPENYG